MKMKKPLIGFIYISLLLILTACGGVTQLEFTPTGQSLPSRTATKTILNTPTSQQTTRVVNTPTLLPSPTPTPRIHEVKKGETLGGIAWIYGVSLDELIKLNEDVNVRAMSVGTKLRIPSETLPPANQTPVPTPIQMPLRNLNCQEVIDGGIWCFMVVENTSGEVFESVSVNVNIADVNADSIISQTAFAPLNLLQPGMNLPVAVYFPAPVPIPFQSSAQFVSAIPLDDPGSRYVSVLVENLIVTQSEDQKSAQVMGSLKLEEPATTVRLLAVAYDETGQIIGVRRHEMEGTDINDGVFDFQVYAADGFIQRVAVLVEAQR